MSQLHVELQNELKNCLEKLKAVYVEYYNNWVQDTHKFTADCAPECNLNYQGYESQRRRYKILNKIISNKRITESDFIFLNMQPQLKCIFDKFKITFSTLTSRFET